MTRTGSLRPPFDPCLALMLLRAATSGNPRFFAGTDSAPHREASKLSCCGHAGCFSANAAAELYTEAFDEAGALDKLEGFLSVHGAKFYGLEPAKETITFVKTPQTIPVRCLLCSVAFVYGGPAVAAG